MAFTVIVHLQNEEPMVAELEELPPSTATCFTCVNPRRRDGKPLSYLSAECTRFVFSWNRVSFIEVMPSEDEEKKIVEFYRD
jgi:hypothetical protein